MQFENSLLYFGQEEKDIMSQSLQFINNARKANKKDGLVKASFLSDKLLNWLSDSQINSKEYEPCTLQAYATIADFNITANTVIDLEEDEIPVILSKVDALVYYLNKGNDSDSRYFTRVCVHGGIRTRLLSDIFNQTGIWQLGCLSFVVFDYRDGKREISSHHLVDMDGNARLDNYQLLSNYLSEFNGISDNTEEELSVLDDYSKVYQSVREYVGEQVLSDVKGYAMIDNVMTLIQSNLPVDTVDDLFKSRYISICANQFEANTGKDVWGVLPYELDKEDAELFECILKNTMRMDAEAVCKELELYFGKSYKYYLGVYYLHLILDRCDVSVVEWLQRAINGEKLGEKESKKYTWFTYVIDYMREKSIEYSSYFPMLHGSCGLALINGKASLISKEAMAVLLLERVEGKRDDKRSKD